MNIRNWPYIQGLHHLVGARPRGKAAAFEQLAAQIGVTFAKLDAVIKDRAPVTDDLAEKLSDRFGTTAEFWINCQHSYDESLHANLVAEIENFWGSKSAATNGDRLADLIAQADQLEKKLEPWSKNFPKGRNQPPRQERPELGDLSGLELSEDLSFPQDIIDSFEPITEDLRGKITELPEGVEIDLDKPLDPELFC